MPAKILIDANFLFLPLEFKIDIFSKLEEALQKKIEPILPAPVMHEIEKLSRSKSPKMRKKASFALELAKKCHVMSVELQKGEKVDDLLIRLAKSLNAIVATNDRYLRKKLRTINIPMVHLRQKSRLQAEGV